MKIRKRIELDVIERLVESPAFDEISTQELLSLYENEAINNRGVAEVLSTVDPRSNEAIIYNPSRVDRPHDYHNRGSVPGVSQNDCPICEGDTTGILDLVELSEGYSFINKNLYPVLSPPDFQQDRETLLKSPVWGMHLVQWSSSFHDRNWQNMPLEDCAVVMSRLAAAEKKLFVVGQEISKDLKDQGILSGDQCYVSVIKNVGSAVGGSLEHDHQQIILGNLAPRRILNNQRFLNKQGKTFSEYSQLTNPPELLIRDYGKAIILVSEFMRRPYEMILAVKDFQKSYLHELDPEEILAISKGWKDATRLYQELMPEMKRELAYNVVTHNGPGAGLYFEFLPYTQEQGGLEHLGLAICQAEPEQAAKQIRAKLA